MNKVFGLALISVLLMATEVPAEKTTFTLAERIQEILRTNQILSKSHQQDLEEMVINRDLASKPFDDLDEVFLAIDDKIKRDLMQFNLTLQLLDRLRFNRYTFGFARFKTNDLDECTSLYKRLVKAVDDSDTVMTKYRVAMSKDEYMENIINKLRFLLKEPYEPTVPALWDTIREATKTTYRDWNARYVSMQKRVKKFSEKQEGRNFNFDEEEFSRTFGELRAQLRRLAEDGSREF